MSRSQSLTPARLRRPPRAAHTSLTQEVAGAGDDDAVGLLDPEALAGEPGGGDHVGRDAEGRDPRERRPDDPQEVQVADVTQSLVMRARVFPAPFGLKRALASRLNVSPQNAHTGHQASIASAKPTSDAV